MRAHLSIATLAAVAVTVGGCGGDAAQEPSRQSDREVTALSKYRSAVDSPKRDFRPHLTGRKILEIRLTGDQAGTSDVARYGDDGSAVLVRAYGGGGFYTFACRLTTAELAAVERDLRRLPLDRAPKVRERARPTFYTAPAPTYVVQHGRYVGTFTRDAIPADGRPFALRIKRMMRGKEGHCQEDFGQRPR